MNYRRRPDRRRAKSRARNTITYAHVCGPELRPKGSMPIEKHQQVGRLIKSLLAATLEHRGIKNCLNMVREDLDDWVAREFTRDELPQSTFFNIYYGENERGLEGPTDREAMVEQVELVKKILSSNYPDCAPLRSLLKSADRAIVMIRRRELTCGARRRGLPDPRVGRQIVA